MTARWYIAGPMTGMPDLNFEAFHERAAELRAAGFEVENPAEINIDPGAKWEDCMRRDIPRLCLCDAILLLPGWQKSRGARLEAMIARQLGLQMIEYHPEAARVTA